MKLILIALIIIFAACDKKEEGVKIITQEVYMSNCQVVYMLGSLNQVRHPSNDSLFQKNWSEDSVFIINNLFK